MEVHIRECPDLKSALSAGPLPDRLIGWVRGPEPGPLLLCVGGLHGNESAGVEALEDVVAQLEDRVDQLRGDFVAFRGNVRALAAGRRFHAFDLNRAWTSEPIERDGEEALEVAEIRSLMNRVLAERRGSLFTLDLHTTSGDGGAFTTVGDSLDNREFAQAIPVPLVLGLEELVEGTLVGRLSEMGFTTAVFECGQHGEPRARGRAAAAVWIAVRAAGLMGEQEVPEAARGYAALSRESEGLPRVLEMRYRHPVAPEDGYRTRPGLENFQPVRAGEVLAEDRGGAVVAPEEGRLLMPLYQAQGQDGFFVVREFSRAWLWVSKMLRRLGAARIVHWLPGVSRDPTVPGALVADRRVARWFALELFHLLGYRRHLEEQHRLVVVKRRRPLPDGG